MNYTFYCFNPEHDLALANADRNFNPPLSARKLATDLGCLPVWYASPGGIILAQAGVHAWLAELQKLFPFLRSVRAELMPDFDLIDTISPWGWDAYVCKSLVMIGASPELLLDNERLEVVRRLSHRRLAICATEAIRGSVPTTDLLAPAAIEFHDVDDVAIFAQHHVPVVFKAPWSGSGKGLSWLRGAMTDSHSGWCRNVIEKQGSLIAEPVYDIVQDFAMLYRCGDGVADFVGYSLFETERGIYRSNALMSDDAILDWLSQWLSKELLISVRDHLKDFLEKELASVYSGILGVDMFVYQEGNEFKLHACVEINLRMTMGYVARTFFDSFMKKEQKGQFYVDHFPRAIDLWHDHVRRKENMPLVIADGRLVGGYLALTCVTPQSNYRVRVEVG